MDVEKTIPLQETLSNLPPEVTSTNLFTQIHKAQETTSFPLLVILDDDPTGTQTCHDINVLTVWDHQTLLSEFSTTTRGFFILTNSRALHTPKARDLIREICTAVKKAAEASDKKFEIVLRGDSTLRGHFPDEPEVAQDVLGAVDGWILAPFFRQGGRLTIDDVHYVADYPDDKLVPAAQTPFAKDASFGYVNSDLKEYVVEKSKGKIERSRVVNVSLQDVRVGGSKVVTEKLVGWPKGVVIVVNAVVDTDMEVFMQGLLEAQKSHSKTYIYRTGAAFVSTRLGIPQIPPLTPESLHMDLSSSAPGGLIIAGSHVPKTTSQLNSLTSDHPTSETLHVITLDASDLLQNSQESIQQHSDNDAISLAITSAGSSIQSGRDVLLMTSRDLITGSSEESSLQISAVVADALVRFLQTLTVRPRYVIAKGGITSSDSATKGLGMKKAKVVGQAASGVPLWIGEDDEADGRKVKWKGIPFVVFPGNVGDVDALRDLVRRWSKQK